MWEVFSSIWNREYNNPFILFLCHHSRSCLDITKLSCNTKQLIPATLEVLVDVPLDLI